MTTKQEIKALDLRAALKLHSKAQTAYYNTSGTEPVMTDQVFDLLEDHIRSLDPEWAPGVGAKVGAKVTATLPVPCPSLDKIKADPARLWKWAVRNRDDANRVWGMPKLDGSALEAVYAKDGSIQDLITRGDGVNGKSVKHFIPALVKAGCIPAVFAAPKRSNPDWRPVVRLEAIVPNSEWKKYQSEFDSARSMSAALLNRQDVHRALAKGALRLIALRLVSTIEVDGVPSRSLPLDQGFELLEAAGFETVPHADYVVSEDVGEFTGLVGEVFGDYREGFDVADFGCDGMVFSTTRPAIPTSADNPLDMVAYKEDTSIEDAPETTIRSVEWEVSRTGRVVPVAVIDTVVFEGTKVKRATLNNYQWALQRGAGIGALVRVVRGGEIIPKIVAVLKAAKKPLAMPTAEELGVESVATKGVDVVVSNAGTGAGSASLRTKQFSFALERCGFKHLRADAARAFQSHYEHPLAMLEAAMGSPVEFMQTAQKLGLSEMIIGKALALQSKVRSIPMERLMQASGVLPAGLGEELIRRALLQSDGGPYSGPVLASRIKKAVGNVAFEKLQKSAPVFFSMLNNSPTLRSLSKWPTAEPAPAVVSGPLTGRVVYLSGYRNEDHVAELTRLGAKVSSKFDATVNTIVFKEGGKPSSKGSTVLARGGVATVFNQLVSTK